MPAYYLGIDASKGYADFMMLDKHSHPLDEGFQLDDTHTGHQKLFGYLQTFCSCNTDATIYAALESTGGYENNWYNGLRRVAGQLPIHVARLNAFRVKANSDASAKLNKTDPISAKDIAEYLITHPTKVTYDEDQDYTSLRRQWSFIKINIKQNTQLRNHLGSLLYESMPELLRFCRQGIPGWLLKVIKKYPTYQAISNAGAKQLSKFAYLSESKAHRIIKLVDNGIGQSDAVCGQIIRALAKQILQSDHLIEQLKKQLETNCQEAKDKIDLLCSFKGIGIYSAVGLLLNISAIENFPTVKKLAAFFGVHPVYRKSGDGKWGYHMSKKGRAEPRAILYMIAFSAIQHNPIIKNCYARCLRKGMNKSAAMGVCMHKILRIIYGMLKNNTTFDPNIHQQHQQKNQQNSTQSELNKKRKLQPFDQDAPISRRQLKKRKEQASSQNESNVKCEIKEPVPPS